MEWNELTKEVLNVLLPALLTILGLGATYLGFIAQEYVKVAKERLAEKLSYERLKQIEEIVKASVLWVEQITGIDVEYEAKEKLQSAKERISFLLKEKGIEASDKLIETLIESFVLGLKNNKGIE